MPTKPTSTFTFATDDDFTSGPADTEPTKIVPGSLPQGFIPGLGINAEWVNYLFNITGSWVNDWLLVGTSAADETAHLVETTAAGVLNVAQGVFTGRAAGTVGLSCTGTGSSFGALFQGGTTGAGAPGLQSTGGGTAGDGLWGIGVGTGDGGVFTGGSTGAGGAGISASGSGTAGAGTTGTGSGTGAGGSFTGGATGAGVIGAGLGGASGVVGTAATTGAGGTFTGGATDGIGVVASGSGAGSGIVAGATGSTGYGVVAQSDTTSPTRSALRVVPQSTADPTTRLEGDVWVNDTIERLCAHVGGHDASVGIKDIWATFGGLVHRSGNSASGTNNDNASWTTILEVNFTAGTAEIRRVNEAVIRCSGEFGNVGTTAHDVDIRVRDVTAATDLYSETIELQWTGADNYEKFICVDRSYVIPSTGARQIQFQFKKSTSGGSGVQYREAFMEFAGMYEN
jgi:hypothetical protein